MLCVVFTGGDNGHSGDGSSVVLCEESFATLTGMCTILSRPSTHHDIVIKDTVLWD